ncbi:MAG: ketoacyl-ACP synthase III [Verrucomicrobia bacterium]|nr:ketoacyl-ACP synthase III [Verrucomicrobiota bacterium]MCH8510193.1 ketoacyl-ACP synthase III [Kiritimatiellia bacterium]
MPIHILGTGSYTPEKVLTNQELEKMVETNDEWITTRTGIRQRHIAAEHEATSDLATHAARIALESAGMGAEDVDIIFVATCTPDMAFPSTATLVQEKIGAKNAFAMDLSAACTGFVYGLEVARNMLESGRYKTALVIGAEKMSSIVNWEDRGTCILFGDGAGAVVISSQAEGQGGLGPCNLGSDGALSELLMVPAGGSRRPVDAQVLIERSNTICMAGQEVFKHAVNNMTQTAKHLLSEAGWDPSELNLVIPHQANKRILEAIRIRVGVPKDNVFVNVDKYGNTSAASIGIALDEAVRTGRLHPGDKVMLLAFGAGFTWGGMLLEWRTPPS